MEREGANEQKWIYVTWTLFKYAHILSFPVWFFFFMLVPSEVTSSVKQHRKVFVFASSKPISLLQYNRKEPEIYLLKFIRNIPFLWYIKVGWKEKASAQYKGKSFKYKAP